MTVTYVTMQFPAPTETFATNEVRTLTGEGAVVTVHGLRRAHPRHVELVHERGVGSVRVTHNGVRRSLRGAAAAVARPGLLLRTVGRLLRMPPDRRRDAALSFALLPRAFDILAQVERDRPDVVHMYWGHFPALVGFLVQHRLPDQPTSMSIVAYDLNREYPLAPEVARAADVVRTHARVNVEHVARFTGLAAESVHVIYNGVDLAWLDAHRTGVERIRGRIVTVGRLMPEKGMDHAIHAFAQVLARRPDATLVVLGDGPERARLASLARQLGVDHAVSLLGHVPHARAIVEMARAEVFVLLSRYEGERLPNVVKEAMACGCVCVTTPTAGIEELVQDGATGFIVPMATPDAAAAAMTRALAGETRTAAMASAARRHVEEAFDLHRSAPRYLGLWRAALERRQAEASA